MYCTRKLRCPSYGVTTPIWSGLMPAFRNLVTIFSTLAASVRLRKLVPLPAISSWPLLTW